MNRIDRAPLRLPCIHRLSPASAGGGLGVIGMDTDANGNFQIPDFYPEEFERVYLLDDENKEIWSEDPRKWPSTGTIRVELKK